MARSQQTYHHSLGVTTMRYKALSIIFLCFGSGIGNSSQAVDEPLAVTEATEYEAAIAEFREIICAAAVNVDSPIHQRALSAVESHRYTDSRFADFFRDAMKNQGSDLEATKRKRVAAMRLLPFASIEDPEKATLLLDALASEEEGFCTWVVESQSNEQLHYTGTSTPVMSIVSVLQRDTASWASVLKDRLRAEPPLATYCALAGHLPPSPELMSLLIKATQSERPGIQLAATDSLDSMIGKLEREPRSKRNSDANAATTLPPINDEKLERYARQIISRYDKNGDGALTVDEWKAMLVDPSPADSNQDGRVSVEEYARYIMARSRR